MKRAEAGFTLLELLLAVALLATLMVMLSNGVSLVSHRLDRGTERRDRAEVVALVQNYLRAALSQALPVAIANDTNAVIDFNGDASHVSFVTRAPASSPLGGMIKLDLRFVAGKTGNNGALVVDWQPYGDVGPVAGRTGSRQLIGGAGAVGFAYFDPGTADRAAGWQPDWHDLPALPSLVRMSVGFNDGDTVPDLVVALRLSSPAAAAGPTPVPPAKTQ